jgi:biotin carboxyl carrier protein
MNDLDAVVRLTSRRTWTMATAMVLVLATAAAWAVLTRVESTVPLYGVLVAGTGPDVVTAPADATVVDMLVHTGQTVAANAPIVVLDVGGGKHAIVRSPSDGVLSGLGVRAGAPVSRGAVIGTVDHVGAPLSALLLANANAVVAPGATVRGAGFHGQVTSVEPYAVPADQVARRYGLTTLPVAVAPGALVRPVLVDLRVPAWQGATLTPVRLDLVVGQQRPIDLVLRGGAP